LINFYESNSFDKSSDDNDDECCYDEDVYQPEQRITKIEDVSSSSSMVMNDLSRPQSDQRASSQTGTTS
jgi:hypothetical protein